VAKVIIAEKRSPGAKAQSLFCSACSATEVVPFQNLIFNTPYQNT
jgi:hypothetical protein